MYIFLGRVIYRTIFLVFFFFLMEKIILQCYAREDVLQLFQNRQETFVCIQKYYEIIRIHTDSVFMIFEGSPPPYEFTPLKKTNLERETENRRIY